MKLFIEDYINYKSELYDLVNYLNENLAGNVSGSSVANVVYKFVTTGKEQKNPKEIINQLCALFDVTLSNSKERVLEGTGWIKISKERQLLFHNQLDKKIHIGKASTPREISVIIHEIGHLLYILLTYISDVLENSKFSINNLDEEDFCWDFALGLHCPDEIKKKWSLEYINELLTQKERDFIKKLELPGELEKLTYLHIRSLAQKHRITIRATIRALDRHPILDKAKTGISVFRYSSNQWTGIEKGLRLWNFARPSWGHVIKNQRVIKQGFEKASTIFENGLNQNIELANENLILKERLPENKPAWRKSIIQTVCAYTPVDVKNEGRYLVAIWHWPKPKT